MLNEAAPDTPTTEDPSMEVLEGITLRGGINVSDEVVQNNVRHSIRLGYPQIKTQALSKDRVCLVGGGPSLNSTEKELVQLVHAGAKLVTTNGAYQWCLEHNLRPQTQIVLDARANNARFLEPAVPNCNYVLSSQCHPSAWAAVEGRPNVWIFHGIDPGVREILDDYYMGNWIGIGGGTTVGIRAISLLRTLGYLRFDLFGMDSCWMDGEHHAFEQPENVKDKRYRAVLHPVGHPELAREFQCSTWHVKQLEDFLQLIRANGEHFWLNIHGNGLLAYALETSAQLEYKVKEQ